MSSPTLNLPQGTGDTSLETIMNLVRSLVNDTQAGLTDTPGEGQVFTDNPSISPFTQPFLNSAIRQLYRELRNIGDPTLVFDNVIVSGLPIINSPTNGPGGPDPAVQTVLSTSGYFDGVQIWPNYLLPSNCLFMETVWERATNSNNNFQRMSQVQDGLPSRPQQPDLAQWEWRNNNLNFVGATTVRDLRMRYYGSLPTFFSPTLNFSSTYVPIFDCTDAVAYKTATMYARMLGSPGLQDLAGEAKEQMFQLKNQVTRRMQSINYRRSPYGHSDGDLNNAFLYGFW